MLFMNDFVERQWSSMQRFLQEISAADGLNLGAAAFDGYVDLGRELACLHTLLTELDQVSSCSPGPGSGSAAWALSAPVCLSPVCLLNRPAWPS